MDAKEQILSLLASGVSNSQIAKATGTSESYVSQVKTDNPQTLPISSIDSKYNSMEERLADKLDEFLPLINKPQEILAALVRINSLKRRSQDGISSINSSHVTNNVVQITLPAYMATRFQTNANNEVIAVNDRSLVTMGNKEVIANLANYESTSKRLSRNITEEI
jgi:hypothetical protein